VAVGYELIGLGAEWHGPFVTAEEAVRAWPHVHWRDVPGTPGHKNGWIEEPGIEPGPPDYKMKSFKHSKGGAVRGEPRI
jgi:hypothetical protein